MTKLKKIVRRFYENPAGLHYSDIEKILIGHGCIKIPAKGSHTKFKHHLSKNDLIIPIHANDCKELYKKCSLKFLKDNNLL